jgi:hypothetical protein
VSDSPLSRPPGYKRVLEKDVEPYIAGVELLLLLSTELVLHFAGIELPPLTRTVFRWY